MYSGGHINWTMSKKTPNDLNRRNMLKGSAAGMLAAASTTNVAAAKQDVELSDAEEADLLREFQSVEMVDSAVHEQSDLLEELAADGVLERAQIDGLDSLSEPVDSVGEELTTYQIGERFTPQIKIFRRVEAGYLSLSVFPEENEAYALLNPVEDRSALGKEHLIEYGNLPEADPQACWDPGQCQDCGDCTVVCCHRDPQGDCTQWCNQCSCTCVCCGCGPLCLSYC